ncbi:hypothetical protein Pcinc_002404 [Petrolisthes cinctipes]|uniref:Uncharacterized protein n=1 Tax=Petrolisthes cinctipes TaxID=88211 RepID=A0AAE1GL05_PETCI|nr:hypothetical protein Pcinc_002404 [Petrolisthes cinctipes]
MHFHNHPHHLPHLLHRLLHYFVNCTFNYLSMDTWSRSYVVVLFLASYAVPLVVVCYAYFGIVSSVSRHDRNLKSHEVTQGGLLQGV